MSVVPKKLIERVQWWEDHLSPFSTNAVAIGISSTEATDLTTKTEAARAKYDAQQAASQASKVATQEFYDAAAAMTATGAALLKKVRGKAELVGGNSVYNLAQIPAPVTPSPIGPPGTPADFKVQLFQNGSLELSWKCANPAGTTGVIYQVYRKPAGAPDIDFTYLGGAGDRKFVDATIPAGVTAVTYQIQGVRSTAVGNWAQFNVSFGTNAAGAPSVSVVATPAKLAA